MGMQLANVVIDGGTYQNVYCRVDQFAGSTREQAVQCMIAIYPSYESCRSLEQEDYAFPLRVLHMAFPWPKGDYGSLEKYVYPLVEAELTAKNGLTAATHLVNDPEPDEAQPELNLE